MVQQTIHTTEYSNGHKSFETISNKNNERVLVFHWDYSGFRRYINPLKLEVMHGATLYFYYKTKNLDFLNI